MNVSVQEGGISSALALEIPHPCTELLKMMMKLCQIDIPTLGVTCVSDMVWNFNMGSLIKALPVFKRYLVYQNLDILWNVYGCENMTSDIHWEFCDLQNI